MAAERHLTVVGQSPRRAAFRVDSSLPVWVTYPVELDCNLLDVSVAGACFDVALPLPPGTVCEFVLVTEEYGTIPLTGEVVRIGAEETAVSFSVVRHDAARALKELVLSEQRHRLQLQRVSTA